MTTLRTVSLPESGSWGLSLGDSQMLRSLPEPRSSGGAWLRSAASAVSTIGQAALGVSGLGNGAEITNLLNQQIQIQQVMQTVSMASNIARSQHETEMAPIRNMRVG